MLKVILYLIQAWWEIKRSSAKTARKTDEFPSGFGDFGTDVSNPIPCKGMLGPHKYLTRLTFTDGTELSFERQGSTGADNIEADIIDRYAIMKNGQHHATLYLCPYQKRTSRKTPAGYKFK